MTYFANNPSDMAMNLFEHFKISKKDILDQYKPKLCNTRGNLSNNKQCLSKDFEIKFYGVGGCDSHTRLGRKHTISIPRVGNLIREISCIFEFKLKNNDYAKDMTNNRIDLLCGGLILTSINRDLIEAYEAACLSDDKKEINYVTDNTGLIKINLPFLISESHPFPIGYLDYHEIRLNIELCDDVSKFVKFDTNQIDFTFKIKYGHLGEAESNYFCLHHADHIQRPEFYSGVYDCLLWNINEKNYNLFSTRFCTHGFIIDLDRKEPMIMNTIIKYIFYVEHNHKYNDIFIQTNKFKNSDNIYLCDTDPKTINNVTFKGILDKNIMMDKIVNKEHPLKVCIFTLTQHTMNFESGTAKLL